MRWTLTFGLVATMFAFVALAAPEPVRADPVLYNGAIFKGSTGGGGASKIANSRKGAKYRDSRLQAVKVVYNWDSPGSGLATGAQANFNTGKKQVNFARSMANMFGKKFGKNRMVTLTLFTGSGNSLTVGSQEELAQALSSPTGALQNAFAIGGTINFALKVISKKNGKVHQQINDRFVFNPNGLSVVGETDDGIAMFLQGKTKGGKSGVCVKKKQNNCRFLRRAFYGAGGFNINLAMTGTDGLNGDGGPILDPLEEIEENENNEGTNGNGTGTGGGTNGTDGGTRIAAVAEPGTLGLLTLGAFAMGYLRRRAARA